MKKEGLKVPRIMISHSDLDGVGCMLLNEYFGEKFDKQYIINYDQIKNNKGEFIFPLKYPLTKDDDVILTDLSVMPEFYEYIKNNSKSYKIFDHHDDTALLINDPNVTYDKKKSGTLLYYEYLSKGKRIPMKLKTMVDYIHTYDTYNDESPLWEEAQNMNRLFYKIYSWGLEPVLAVQRFINLQLNKLKSVSQTKFEFSDYEQQKIQEVLEQESKILAKAKATIKYRVDNAGNKFGVIVIPSKISITCYNLLKENPDVAYIIAINAYRGINGKVSVRAQKNLPINVNYLLGIGGHEKAGGGEFPIDFLVDFSRSSTLYLEYSDEHANKEIVTNV